MTSPVKGVRRAIVAAAKAIKAKKIQRTSRDGGWQDEIWAYYDQVGELRFVTNTIANAMGLVRLYVAIEDDAPDSDGYVEVTDSNDLAVQALDALGGDSPTGISAIMSRFGQHLFAVGETYLVGHPELPEVGDDGRPVDPDPDDRERPGIDPLRRPVPSRFPEGLRAPGADDEDGFNSLCWTVLSKGEIKLEGGELSLSGVKIPDPDSVLIVRIWRPHPRKITESDSPVRSSMPVLRELLSLTMKVSADIDSRLAGNGIMFVPQSVDVLDGPAPEEGEEEPTFVEAFIDHAISPIKDRDMASAVVPLVATLPDEMAWQPFHLRFDTQLDATAQQLRDEAIRRLAMGWDVPPERLLGMGDTNHWSAWQLAEDEVKLYVAPPVDLVRDALTREFLRPILQASDSSIDASKYVIMADYSPLTLRPDRSADGFQLHDRDLISDDALRAATGFGPEDAPPEKPLREVAVAKALEWAQNNPAFLDRPGGLESVVQEILAVLEGTNETQADALAEPEAEIVDEDRDIGEDETGPPGTQPESGDPGEDDAESGPGDAEAA